MSNQPSHLEASRQRLKAAIERTRAEMRSELGGAPSGRLVVPMVAAAAGLALGFAVTRFVGRRRDRALESGAVDQIDLL